jgi:hypothetical protein
MKFKDQHGNEFTWKIRALPVLINQVKKQQCLDCSGTGFVDKGDLDVVFGNCKRCSGSGLISPIIHCYDLELESYLQSKVEDFYKEKRKRESESFLGDGI